MPPPDVRAAQQPWTWETPPGFVPIRPPRGKSSALNYVAVGVVVAAVAALGWFGYQAFFKPAPKAVVTAAPAAAAVTYTSPDGHFTVGLPAQPVTSTFAQSYGPYHLQASMAAVPGVNEVAAGLVVTPSIPAEHMDEFMQGAINGFAHNSQLSNIATSTYQGHPAITATATTDGATVQMLFYAYSSTRMYMLMAPEGASMTALETAFRPTH